MLYCQLDNDRMNYNDISMLYCELDNDRMNYNDIYSQLNKWGLDICVVSIEFSPLNTIKLTTNWYQLHNGDHC